MFTGTTLGAGLPPTPGAAPGTDPSRADNNSVIMRTQLRGTFFRSKLVPLIYLIKSLCPEIGYLAEFREWDRVFSLPPELKSPRANVRLRQHQYLYGVPQPAATAAAVAAAATSAQGVTPQAAAAAAAAAAAGTPQAPGASAPAPASSAHRDVWPAWSLIYSGLPDRRVPAPCERRPVCTSAVGREAESLLALFGCKFNYEYLRKGMRHRTREGIMVDMYYVEKFTRPGDPASSRVFPEIEGDQCGVVELSVDGNSVSPDQLLTFMQYLSPYVTIETPRMGRRVMR